MTTVKASSSLLSHPELELAIDIASDWDRMEKELEAPLSCVLKDMMLECGDIDVAFEDGEATETDEEKRLREWSEWRRKIRRELAQQLRKRGFTEKSIGDILKDLRKLLRRPTRSELVKLLFKWMWMLRKILDAYEEAKRRVGEPPPGEPPPPEPIVFISVMLPEG